MPFEDWIITKAEPEKLTQRGAKEDKVDSGNILVRVTYHHVATGHEFIQDFFGNDVSDDSIAKTAAVRVLALDESIKVLTNIKAGAVVPIVVEAPDDTKEQAYFIAKQRLAFLKQEEILGVIPSSSQEIIDATADAIAKREEIPFVAVEVAVADINQDSK